MSGNAAETAEVMALKSPIPFQAAIGVLRDPPFLVLNILLRATPTDCASEELDNSDLSYPITNPDPSVV